MWIYMMCKDTRIAMQLQHAKIGFNYQYHTKHENPIAAAVSARMKSHIGK